MTLDRLQAHYGFTRTPFGKALAPSMLHRHTAHAEAVARIGWCITERALGVVTGEVGAGKTVAVRAALANLDPSRHTTIYLGNPAVGGRGLYGGIVTALGGEPRFHKAALIPQTVELLAAEEHERGRTVVLILDEAHLLTSDQLEELRLLTNADMDSHSPFACLLIGQPTLRRRIKLGTFAALDQRIALRYTLTAMSDTETKSYLAHHLAPARRHRRARGAGPRDPARPRPGAGPRHPPARRQQLHADPRRGGAADARPLRRPATMTPLLQWLSQPISGAPVHAIAPEFAWHGRLMVLAWSLAVPTAVLLARFFKVTPGQRWPQTVVQVAPNAATRVTGASETAPARRRIHRCPAARRSTRHRRPPSRQPRSRRSGARLHRCSAGPWCRPSRSPGSGL